MIESPASNEASQGLDRLSVFLSAFALTVRVLPLADEPEGANLFLLSNEQSSARRIVFCADIKARPQCGGKVLLAASVEFGGASNPLLRSLPPEVVLDLTDDDPTWPLASMFVAEAQTPRCGSQVALSRLGELLVLMVLRKAIDSGATQPGLLAGLAHPMLRHAICAMLKQPSQPWRMEDLADLSHMSRSRFMEDFRRCVGFTPGAFLAGWRLTLGHRQLQQGKKVKAVASSVGFASAAAFSRAYSRAFSNSPAGTARDSTLGPHSHTDAI